MLGEVAAERAGTAVRKALVEGDLQHRTLKQMSEQEIKDMLTVRATVFWDTIYLVLAHSILSTSVPNTVSQQAT